MQLLWDTFGASAMQVEGVGLHLTALKVKLLAEELSEHGAPKSGRNRALQLRLAAASCADHRRGGGAGEEPARRRHKVRSVGTGSAPSGPCNGGQEHVR